MINAQKWLDENFQKEFRRKVGELYIENKELEGVLDLTDFINLRELDCSENKLTCLKLSGLRRLAKIGCSENSLDNFDYSSLNPNELIFLNISDNNLPEQDLSVFSRFIKLEFLWIGSGCEEGITEQKYNRFYGSLKSLQNISNLESLYISNTDVNTGLEYLPTRNLEGFFCSSERKGAKVEEIREKLGLSEEVAESQEKLENNYKIQRIKHFQLFCSFVRKRRRLKQEISRVRPFLKRTYLLAIINIPNEVFFEVARGEIHPSIFNIESEMDEKLRKIGQEIVVNERAENEGLTWKKIDSVFSSWVSFKRVWIPFQMMQQRGIQKMIIGKNSEARIRNALKSLFLETGKEIRSFEEIENSKKIFSFEVTDPMPNFPENLVLAQVCQCVFGDAIEALPYHIECHLTNVEEVVEFERKLIQLINQFKESIVIGKNREKEQQREARMQVALPRIKKL